VERHVVYYVDDDGSRRCDIEGFRRWTRNDGHAHGGGAVVASMLGLARDMHTSVLKMACWFDDDDGFYRVCMRCLLRVWLIGWALPFTYRVSWVFEYSPFLPDVGRGWVFLSSRYKALMT
jgi:hypothetical protein